MVALGVLSWSHSVKWLGGVLPLFMGAEVGPGLWAAWAQGAAAVFTGRRGGFMGAGLRPGAVLGPSAALGLDVLTLW